MEKETGRDVLLTLIGANAIPIALLCLAGWFAYLENGYWGWPFAFALLSGKTLQTAKDKREEERERKIQHAEDIRKYGKIMDN